jgi:hypothetical protein
MILKHIQDRTERIKYVLANRESIVKIKKSASKRCDAFDTPTGVIEPITTKAFTTKADKEGVINRSFIGNTYYWLDSHGDVHLENSGKKTIQENKNILHLHDHKQEITAKVGIIQEAKEIEVAWKDLGVAKAGNTQVLAANSDIYKELNKSVYFQYEKGLVNQHSIGMFYMQVGVAADDASDKEAYQVWKDILPKLGNPEEAEAMGYFFTVIEYKLVEISGVTQASNSLTGMLDDAKFEDQIKNFVQNGVPIEKIIDFCNSIALKREPETSTQTKSRRKRRPF